MSISGSLSNAMSGLRVAAKSAEVVSSNIANALTDGYGRREISVAASQIGGVSRGASTQGVTRIVDERAIADRRLADAGYGNAQIHSTGLAKIEAAIGVPGEGGSLHDRIATLDARLIEAGSRPDIEPRLSAVATAASDLVGGIGAISAEIQSVRLQADQSIGRAVDQINAALQKVADLNHEIRIQRGAGRDAAAVMDQRQQVIDGISDQVPLRVVARDFNQVALLTTGGAVLLDGKPAVLGFTPANTIAPGMSIENGALSGLSINGKEIATQGGVSPIKGGALSGQFQLRDTTAVEAQVQLDALARNLIERFQNPTVDPTLGVGEAGLFTDGALAFQATNEVGISERLRLNPVVDPAEQGESWRLRDGLNATAPGNSGDATGLHRLQEALLQQRTPASGTYSTSARSFSGAASDFLSAIGINRQNAEADTSFALTKMDTLKVLELEAGVDTDHEMQQLLMVEQAYAANARVIQSIDEMMQTLLRI